MMTCPVIWLISQPLTCHTVQLLNKEFAVADDWQQVSLDPAGEDVNSERYGGVSYPPYRTGSDLKEVRPTIALGELNINLDVDNPTDDTWEITHVKLMVTKEYALDQIAYRRGVWDLGKVRTLNYIPKLAFPDDISDQPSNLYISPSADFADTRFWVEVKLEGEGKKAIAFEVYLTLTNLADDGELSIKADKIYLIASK